MPRDTNTAWRVFPGNKKITNAQYLRLVTGIPEIEPGGQPVPPQNLPPPRRHHFGGLAHRASGPDGPNVHGQGRAHHPPEAAAPRQLGIPLPSTSSYRNPNSPCPCCNIACYELFISWMPAELIPFSHFPRLQMTKQIRQKLWPEERRESPSTVYLFCCYLAYRQHVLQIPGNYAMATRHCCAPYAFCADGRPFADYQSPFMPYLTTFAVPDWFIDIYGEATRSESRFVDVFNQSTPCLPVLRREPRLRRVAAALAALDAASADTDKQNRKRRVEAAHLSFFEACKVYERDKRQRRILGFHADMAAQGYFQFIDEGF
ncbi:hypothetical protein MBLNU457_3635t1 [Dothideomycetes sp. NU457]